MFITNLKTGCFFLLLIFIIQISFDVPKKSFAQSEQLKITKPYIKVIGKNAKSAAGYMVIENLGGEKITLFEAVGDFGFTMLHTSEEKDGVVSMIHLDKVDIEKGKKVKFVPGGLHIMFVGITEDLSKASTKNILLKFKNSETSFTKTISFEVKAK
mgnify:FL=1